MSNRRVALVTGGAKRVGREIVQRLAREGFDIAFTYHTSTAAAREQADFLSIQADLTSPDSADSVFEKFTQQFSRLDVLVNNASIYAPGHERLREMTAIHVETPLRLCRLFEPMLRASLGHVVNMLDILAERPWPKYSAYCATKAALWNLTLTLARELAPEVTVNGIAPGVVEWPDDFPQADREQYLRRVPLARAGTPADVASLVQFLATEGRYITGQVIRVDGGRSIA